MVLPLLGLLALGGGAAASNPINEFLDKGASRRRIGALERGGGTFDPETATQQERLFFGGNRPTTSAQVGADNRGRAANRLGQGQLGLAQNKFDFLQDQTTLGQIPTVNGPVDFNLFTNALVGLESGGNYGAVSGAGALGKYQIMPASLKEWSQTYLGEEVTPEQFMANPELQDQLYQARMGDMIQKHGARDALSMWHSGVGLEQAIAEDRNDGNMSTANYVTQGMRAYERAFRDQAQSNQHDFVMQYGTDLDREIMGNEMSPIQAKQKTFERTMAATLPDRGAAIPATTQRLMAQYGDNIATMDPDQVTGILEGETNITNLLTSLDYINNTSAADRVADPARSAEMESMFQMASLPALQEFIGAEALQQAEIDIIDEMRGKPFGKVNLTDSQKRVMAGMTERLQQRRQNTLAGFGLEAPRIQLSRPEGIARTAQELADRAAEAETAQTLQAEAEADNRFSAGDAPARPTLPAWLQDSGAPVPWMQSTGRPERDPNKGTGRGFVNRGSN